MSLTSHTKNSAPMSADTRGKLSLYDAVLGQANSLNFIRLSLATAVIIAHTGPLTGVHADFLGIPSSRVDLIGGWAVNMFFAISGFLIAHSAQRGTAAGYLKRRALRIFPDTGYLSCLLFSYAHRFLWQQDTLRSPFQ